MVLELLEQLREQGDGMPKHVFLQGGVGGMAAAVVAHFWETSGSSRLPTFIVVEPRRAACLLQSAVMGRPTPITGDLETVMAGLACGEVSPLAWRILQSAVEYFMTIEDAAAIESMRLLARGETGAEPIVAGESATAGLAALLQFPQDGPNSSLRRQMSLDERSRVLLFGTEGATDPVLYRALVGGDASSVATKSRVVA